MELENQSCFENFLRRHCSFLLVQKRPKKDPGKGYTLPSGSNSMHQLYYCNFNICFSMLSRDRKASTKLIQPL